MAVREDSSGSCGLSDGRDGVTTLQCPPGATLPGPVSLPHLEASLGHSLCDSGRVTRRVLCLLPLPVKGAGSAQPPSGRASVKCSDPWAAHSEPPERGIFCFSPACEQRHALGSPRRQRSGSTRRQEVLMSPSKG